MKIIILTAVAAAALSACCSNNGASDGGTGTTGVTTTSHGSTSAGSSAGATAGSTSGSTTGSTSRSTAGATATSGGQGSTGSASSSAGGTSGAASTGGTAHLLLVDNDGYPGSDETDLSLPIFTGWLNAAGIAYATYEEPGVTPYDETDVDPANPQLTGINTIVYFTGDNYGDDDPRTISNAQQTLLQAWLDEGDKTLIVFAPGVPNDIGVDRWTSPETNSFLTQYFGFANDLEDPYFWNAATSLDVDGSQLAYYPVSGSSTVPAFQGKAWTIVNNSEQGPYVHDYLSVINPVDGGVDILATVQVDPAMSGANSTAPAAIGYKSVGAKGTSNVIYVGLSVENLTDGLSGENLQCDFLSAVQTYANLGGITANCGVTPPPDTDAGVPTLLVDNDAESTDLSLPVFQGWMTGLGGAYTTYTESTNTPYDLVDVDPGAPELAGLKTIVWFTGDNYGDDAPPTVSDAQQALLASWLDQGGKTLVMFSPGTPAGFGQDRWTEPEPNVFLTNYFGFQDDIEDFDAWSASSAADVAIDQSASEVVTGSTTLSAFNGLQWTVVNNNQNSSYVRFFTSIVNPVSASSDVLATIPADPTDTGANTPLPAALGNKNVGAAGTSNVIYVGLSVENISNTIPGYSTQAQFLQAIATYAAVP